MDTRIEQNGAGSAPLANGGLGRTDGLAASAAEPGGGVSSAGAAGGVGAGQNSARLAEQLKRSAGRVETARAALGQMGDLVETVLDGVKRNASTSDGSRANERLLRSAFATAQDIVEHARVDGQALLGTGRSAPYANRVVDGKTLAALGAYGRNQAAYQSSQEVGDPPLVRHALQAARAFVSGPAGVLDTLGRLAEQGPSTGPAAESALEETLQTISGLRTMLGEARARDVDNALRVMRGPIGSPFDLNV